MDKKTFNIVLYAKAKNIPIITKSKDKQKEIAEKYPEVKVILREWSNLIWYRFSKIIIDDNT